MRELNLPNLLTVLRFALAPCVVIAIVDHRFGSALALVAAAGVTDGLDGLLARMLKVETRFGAYADPIADKVLLSATYLALGFAGAVPWWLVALIFGRDLLILMLAAVALLLTAYRDFPPSIWGKISTFFQILAALGVLVAGYETQLAIPTTPLIWAAGAATAWSGAGYVVRAAQMARQRVKTPVS